MSAYLDLNHYDRVQDARAEAIHPDPAYPPLPEDLQIVTGGTRPPLTNQPPDARPSPPGRSAAGPQTSQARRSHAEPA